MTKIEARTHIMRTWVLLCLTLLIATPSIGHAQQSSATVSQETGTRAEFGDASSLESSNESSDQPQSDNLRQEKQRQEAIIQLREIEISLDEKKSLRASLRKELAAASDDVKASYEQQLVEINQEIELLDKTFEQVAIGGVDLSVFGEAQKKFDWREELVLIVQPLIENIKGLTEKPRKIENLKRAIKERGEAIETANEALASINQLVEQAKVKDVVAKLTEIQQSWRSRQDDLQREIQLAQFQLESLQGKNTRWVEVVQEALRNFVTGRGLTLMLAVLASVLVWGLMAGLLWVFRKRSSESQDRSVKVHYRVAAYAYRALTALLIAIAVMTVLYMRRDLLLLAIVAILLFGMALAFKNLLPRYIAEGRLLLNIGAVRERERVMYLGIPWRVTSINMFCKFTNPKLNGTLRVPIAELHDLVSRPTNATDWFPAAQGDWILDHDDNPMEVVSPGVEMVELRDLDRVSHRMATADFYTAGFRNLSASKVFRVAVRFGIDYSHQNLDTEDVCDAFSKGIERNFSDAPFADHVNEVRVEFDEAAESSLNYVMFAFLDPQAARHHNRIKRRIQSACVAVCNEQDWIIPFPQLTVHRSSNELTE